MDYFGVNDKDKVRANRAPGQSVKAVGDAEDFLDGFRGVADVDYVSSLAFREVYSPTFTEAVNSEAHQIGFVTKDFGAYSFNIYASRYEDFLSTQLVPGNAVIIRQTPEFSFFGTDKQVGESPFYFSFGTSAGALGRTEPGLDLPSLSERLDFHPEVTLRVKEFWGFHLTPSAGVRGDPIRDQPGTEPRPPHQAAGRLLARSPAAFPRKSLRVVTCGAGALSMLLSRT